MKIYLFLLIAVLSITMLNCKKDDDRWDTSGEAYLRDSTVYYTKLLSLWQNYIVPSKVNDILDSTKLRAISKNFDRADDVLDYLTGLTPIHSVTNKPVDRFSFLDREGSVSDEIQNAISTSYGMTIFYLQTASTPSGNAYLYVKMVDRNSPAYIAGIRRGDRIISINGNDKIDYKTQSSQNFKTVNDAINSSSMTLKWRTPLSVDTEKRIISSTFNFDPVLSSKTFDVENKKVGYLAFSSFVNIYDDKNNTTAMYNTFQNIFATFERDGLNTLIVDLRYNGGGSVVTAEYLANKIVPIQHDGKLMYSYKLNPIVQEQLEDEFLPTKFSKKGSLDINKVYFLVTSSSASASELLINTLKPYMDVQVIGSENTYGKPVGFWPIEIGKVGTQAEIYVTSFQMFNADNYGDYFGGLVPNKIAKEDFLLDFGDEKEGFIAEALYHIKNGSYSSASRSAVASVDKIRINNYKSLKDFHYKSSDLGMFKFPQDKRKIKISN